jgi:hypothetical protein
VENGLYEKTCERVNNKGPACLSYPALAPARLQPPEPGPESQGQIQTQAFNGVQSRRFRLGLPKKVRKRVGRGGHVRMQDCLQAEVETGASDQAVPCA